MHSGRPLRSCTCQGARYAQIGAHSPPTTGEKRAAGEAWRAQWWSLLRVWARTWCALDDGGAGGVCRQQSGRMGWPARPALTWHVREAPTLTRRGQSKAGASSRVLGDSGIGAAQAAWPGEEEEEEAPALQCPPVGAGSASSVFSASTTGPSPRGCASVASGGCGRPLCVLLAPHTLLLCAATPGEAPNIPGEVPVLRESPLHLTVS